MIIKLLYLTAVFFNIVFGCMCVSINVSYVWMGVGMRVCMYICMHACVLYFYVCTYLFMLGMCVCMRMCVYVCIMFSLLSHVSPCSSLCRPPPPRISTFYYCHVVHSSVARPAAFAHHHPAGEKSW